MIKFKDFIIIFIVSYILAEFRTSQSRTEKRYRENKKRFVRVRLYRNPKTDRKSKSTRYAL